MPSKTILDADEQLAINHYLNTKFKKWGAFFGAINMAALIGLYSTVTTRVAEKATETAIEKTEDRFSNLLQQYDQLAEVTTEGFATALVDVGQAQEKVNAINQDILGLKELELDQVQDIISLLNESTEEIQALLEATDKIEKTNVEAQQALSRIKSNKDNIASLSEDINQAITDIKTTQKWVAFTYSSAAKHGLYGDGRKSVDIDWQKDHIDSSEVLLEEFDIKNP